MNEPPTATPAPNRAQQTSSKRRVSGFWWLFGGVLLAVILVNEIPSQIRGWKLAAALEARDAGDKAGAKKSLEDLLAKDPRNDKYRAIQYEWNKEDGEYEAALMFLQDELATEKEGTERYALLISERSRIFQHLKRHADAIADNQELVRLSERIGKPSRQQALNGLAYARALAGTELDEALQDADVAVSAARSDLKEVENLLAQAQAKRKDETNIRKVIADCQLSLMATIDTRGMVQLKRGDHTAAQSDFDEAIDNLKKIRAYQQTQYDRYAGVRETKAVLKKQREDDHNDAVIYYHRSLNLKELGRDQDAARDLQKAHELLGREPDDHVF